MLTFDKLAETLVDNSSVSTIENSDLARGSNGTVPFKMPLA